MRRRLWLCAVLSVLPLAGCTTSDPKPGPSPVALPRPALELVAFDSCARLLTELRAAASANADQFGQRPEAFAVEGSRAMSAAAEAVPAPTTYSGTNVHEQGADEPDIVKTDGRRIVTVDQGTLYVIDPATRTRTGKLALGVTGDAQLLLAGDRALVLGTSYPVVQWRGYVPPEQATADAILVDLTGTPRVISRYRGVGRMVDARQTGDVARVVLSTIPAIKFPMTADSGDDLLKNTRKAINKAGVDAWLPQWEVTTGGVTSKGRMDCGAVSRPASFSGATMLSVLTFDLAAPALTDGSPVGVVADGDTVYGTPSSLYIANDQRWRMTTRTGKAAPDTEIFKFALPAAGKPQYTAGGTVPGLLVNQYAMSEWDGYLRVATTDLSAQSSAVRVLASRGGKLTQVGVVSGLGKGEQIYSVRFIGARGYVVTFRQTDPLYSLDLGDPARPRVTGALKITGYSAHLQPVGDNLLVGVGEEASAQGVRQGLQVSLFDVSDPASPRRLAQHVIPGTESEAEFDPHALLWWPATNLLVLPIAGSANGAVALHVTGGRIDEAGRPALGTVRRSLVVGDQLWTLGDANLTVADLSTLDRVGTVRLT